MTPLGFSHLCGVDLFKGAAASASVLVVWWSGLVWSGLVCSFLVGGVAAAVGGGGRGTLDRSKAARFEDFVFLPLVEMVQGTPATTPSSRCVTA